VRPDTATAVSAATLIGTQHTPVGIRAPRDPLDHPERHGGGVGGEGEVE